MSQGLALPPLQQLQALLAGAQQLQVPLPALQPSVSPQPSANAAGLMQRVQAAEELAQAVLVSFLTCSCQGGWAVRMAQQRGGHAWHEHQLPTTSAPRLPFSIQQQRLQAAPSAAPPSHDAAGAAPATAAAAPGLQQLPVQLAALADVTRLLNAR